MATMIDLGYLVAAFACTYGALLIYDLWLEVKLSRIRSEEEPATIKEIPRKAQNEPEGTEKIEK